MKSFYSSILALLAAVAGASAQTTTATTPPVGYVTLGALNNSDTNFSVPMQTASAWAGVSTNIAGNVISVAASTFTANQYAPVAPVSPSLVTSNNYLLQPTSGALKGRQLKVTANGTDSVTVDSGGANTIADQGFLSGDSFVIRPYWTLNTLFPSGGGFVATNDITNPSTILFVTENTGTGVNRSAAASYAYDDGSDTGLAGWYNTGDYSLANDVVIDPASVLTAHNTSGSALSFVISGTVPTVQVTTLVVSDTQPNDNNLQLSFPVDTTLAQSHLYESGVIAATSDITNPSEQLFVFDPSVVSFNPGASATYAYDDGSDTGLAGWYNTGDYSLSTGAVLKAGSIIIIRKAPAGSLTATPWVAPTPYTL